MREVLVSCREKWKKIIADFQVLGLFMAKKHDLSEKLSRAGAVAVERKFFATPTLQPRPWELESWSFGSRPHLGHIDVLQT
jgi:hypothetical protein